MVVWVQSLARWQAVEAASDVTRTGCHPPHDEFDEVVDGWSCCAAVNW
jgi:hypothetical protein